ARPDALPYRRQKERGVPNHRRGRAGGHARLRAGGARTARQEVHEDHFPGPGGPVAMGAAAPREKTRINLKKNDTVTVVSGREAGKQGKVLKATPEKNRVIGQGVGFVKKHTRPNPQRNIKGGIAEREAAIHASNALIVCGER